MNREVLERPFPKELIKKRKGRGGKQLDYITVGNIIERLNAGFESEWTFEIMQSTKHDDEILVLGRLAYGEISKMQYGGKVIEVYTKGAKQGEVICITDDYKAAASDALKKCATMFGVALEFYMDVSETEASSGGGQQSQGDKTQPSSEKPADKKAGESQADESTGKRQSVGCELAVRKLALSIGISDVKVEEGVDTSKGFDEAKWKSLLAKYNKYKVAAEWLVGKLIADEIDADVHTIYEFSQFRPMGWKGLYADIKAIKEGRSVDALWTEYQDWLKKKDDKLDENADDLKAAKAKYSALIDGREGWETPAKRIAQEAKLSDKLYPVWGIYEFLNAITALQAEDKLREGE